jgi:hypothetical protein
LTKLLASLIDLAQQRLGLGCQMSTMEACSEMQQRRGYFIFGDWGPDPLPVGAIVEIGFNNTPECYACRITGIASLEDANVLRALQGLNLLPELPFPMYRAVIE